MSSKPLQEFDRIPACRCRERNDVAICQVVAAGSAFFGAIGDFLIGLFGSQPR